MRDESNDGHLLLKRCKPIKEDNDLKRRKYMNMQLLKIADLKFEYACSITIYFKYLLDCRVIVYMLFFKYTHVVVAVTF